MNSETPAPPAVCEWVWHDGHQFHRCPLAPNHIGRHARNNGIAPTEAEIKEIES